MTVEKPVLTCQMQLLMKGRDVKGSWKHTKWASHRWKATFSFLNLFER